MMAESQKSLKKRQPLQGNGAVNTFPQYRLTNISSASHSSATSALCMLVVGYVKPEDDTGKFLIPEGQ